MAFVVVHAKVERVAGKINARLRVLAVALRAEQIEFSRLQFDDEGAFGRKRAAPRPATSGHNTRRAPRAKITRGAAVVSACVLRMRGVVTVPDIADANDHRIAGVS